MVAIGKALLKRYKVINEIGEGGFGKTYLAQDLALPNQQKCVVKHLSPHNKSPEVFEIAKRLFSQEAESLQNLGKHDLIPSLYAHFHEEGEFYLVQEFIEGNDLSQEIKSGQKLSEIQTIKILENVLEVLEFVHQNNLIHRDIKPSNIMRRKKDGKLILIDFGTVKLPSNIVNVDKRGQTTFHTVAIGSPVYMSCEQSQGKPKQASDIYALGITAIRALSGLKPEEIADDKNTGEIVWRNKVTVSKELGDFIDKMVRFDYRQRYQNATEALTALRKLKGEDNSLEEIELIDNTRISVNRKKDKSSNNKAISIAASFISVLGIAIASFSLINPQNEKEFDFSNLAGYLKSKEWQKADRETEQLLLQIADRNDVLDKEAIDQLDCQLLSKINELWLDSSDGRFGFSPQQEIYYIDTGNIRQEYSETKYKEFGNRIKWRVFGQWKNYSQLTWNDSAPFGHLPTPGTKQNNPELLKINEHWQLLDRTNECGI